MRKLAGVGALEVVNLGYGMSAALVGKHFAELGATVHRIGDPADDPFENVYPAYRYWRSLEQQARPEHLRDLLSGADLCIVGGEDFPGLVHEWVAAELAARHPRLVVLHLTGYVEGSAVSGPAVDLLVQASTGMSWEHYTERPIAFGVPFPTYGQVLMGMLGVWAALVERQNSGAGQVVTATLQQGAGMFMAPFWMAAAEADAEFDKIAPKDANHLVFECADGTYVQMVLGVPQAIVKLYRALGIDLEADPADRGLPKAGAGPGKYFGDMELYAPYVKRLTREQVIANCVREGIPVAPVLQPGEIWSHKQAQVSDMLVEHDGYRTAGVPLMVGQAHSGTPGARPAIDPTGPPLAGLRILDAGAFFAGPYVSKLLSDLGATAVKIEALGGEPLRALPRTFLILCAGKRTIALDAKSALGRDVVGRLVRGFDAVNYNFRPGVAERMGLDPATLRRSNPDLITLNTTGFGPTGPMALDPAFDMVVQALTGLEVRGGGTGNVPQWYRLPYIDFVSGAFGAMAVLMAYYERRETGQLLDLWTSLLDAALFMVSDLVRTPDGAFLASPTLDREQLGFHAAERIYPVRDGWVAVSARGEEAAQRLAEAVGLHGELGLRADWDESAVSAIADRVSGLSAANLVEALAARGVWAAECRRDGLAVLAADSAARKAGLLVDRDDATYGTVSSVTGPLVTFSRSQPSLHGLEGAHRIGAHTREILTELGYSDDEIDQAYRSGAVR
ncbi:CoA transferase [Nocardia sp. R6R-6]|uniref:CoA transferase n=1 Tax=Nocardia sp. R6R-6 TaxID=3459303 RepID=UPI00403E2EA3